MLTTETTTPVFALALGKVRGALKLACLAILVALALMLATPGEAGAQEAGVTVADSDGYVPVYYTCYAGGELGYYDWYSDGYGVYGSVTIDSCAMDDLGAGPLDYERLLAHEFGHAAGYGHSLDPYDVMYHYMVVTGT